MKFNFSPNPFYYVGEFFDWKKERKIKRLSKIHKKFAWFPIQMGNSHSWKKSSDPYVWLQFYSRTGVYNVIPVKIVETHSIFDSGFIGGETYWIWERSI